MNDTTPLFASGPVSGLSSVALASVLDQSVDCVKLVGMDGTIRYMNGNGLCAMEIDDFCAIEGQPWASLWPEEARAAIVQSLATANSGATARFRAFCPTAKGDPRWWDVSVSAVTDREGLQVGYLSVSRDVTESETAREALEIAATELKHRLANTYAMIGGLLMGFARGNPLYESFADAMRERLSTLGRAQALFATKDAPCEIDKLVPILLGPFENANCPITVTTATASCVNQPQADAIALAMGELAVNASKHGALGNGGTIEVKVSGSDGDVVIEWIERSLRKAEAESRTGGQGLILMARVIRSRRGSFDVAWDDYGPTVRLVFKNG